MPARPGRHDNAATSRANLEETPMGRKYIDCRDMPSDTKCTIAISADSTDEVVDAAAQHAAKVHKHADSPELRNQIKAMVKEGNPRA
jgi:predicted small metal-binding protein